MQSNKFVLLGVTIQLPHHPTPQQQALPCLLPHVFKFPSCPCSHSSDAGVVCKCVGLYLYFFYIERAHITYNPLLLTKPEQQ
jgi:hypothetical protein